MDLLKPSLVALDSSHWANLIKAATSPSSAMRAKARAFPELLLAQGYVPLLCWHHFEELLAIEDDPVVEARLAFIESLPLIAWIQPIGEPHGFGAITDVVAAEALAICDGADNPAAVRDEAKARLVRVGSGLDAIGPDRWVWHLLRPSILEHNARSRTIMAIAPVKFIDGSTPISTLMNQSLRPAEEIKAQLAIMTRRLAGEIAVHGDRRIRNPEDIAAAFFAETAQMAPKSSTAVRDFIFKVAEAQGVRAEEITPEMTIDQLGRLGVFRSKLRTVADKTGRPVEELWRSVRMEQCPHWIVEDALDRFRPVLPERRGSDLNDSYLAVLAAYADHLYVDKRKAENFRQAIGKAPTLNALIGRVWKTAHYADIPQQLAEGGAQRA